ncbi:MAG: hypothetical protein IJ723_00920, partial [Ruminococcus sp.]|nr:hypothetical protein [Ruminococcus sp.]
MSKNTAVKANKMISPAEKRSRIPYPALQLLTVLILAASATASGMGFVVIAGSNVPRLLAGLCGAVLVVLPAFCTKTFAVLTGFRNRRSLCVLAIVGYALSMYPIVCFYVSHDYQL